MIGKSDENKVKEEKKKIKEEKKKIEEDKKKVEVDKKKIEAEKVNDVKKQLVEAKKEVVDLESKKGDLEELILKSLPDIVKQLTTKSDDHKHIKSSLSKLTTDVESLKSGKLIGIISLVFSVLCWSLCFFLILADKS